MGSVFVGANILEVSLHGVKKCGGLGGRKPPHLQASLSRVLRGVHMGFVFAARMIAAAMLHSLRITWGCWRERDPSFANRQPV